MTPSSKRHFLALTCVLAHLLVGGTARATWPPSQFVAKMYTEALGRVPSQAEWQAHLASFGPTCDVGQLQGMVQEFYNSTEFLSLGYDNGQRLLALYRGALNREPDPSGFANTLSQLDFGTLSWPQAVTNMVNTAEFLQLSYDICGPNPSYYFGRGGRIDPVSLNWIPNAPAIDIPIKGYGFVGSEADLQAIIDEVSARGGGVVTLAQGAVIRLSVPLLVNFNVTLTTAGSPPASQYAKMARLVSVPPPSVSCPPPLPPDTACPRGVMVNVLDGATLSNVWVDGQRASPADWSTYDVPVAMVPAANSPGGSSAVTACRVSGSRASFHILAYGPLANPAWRKSITGNLVTGYSTDHTIRAADGITIQTNQALVQSNQVIDASDVGIDLFRVVDSGYTQTSTIANNTILNAGNPGYAALCLEPLDQCIPPTPGRWKVPTCTNCGAPTTIDFTGSSVTNNLFWTGPGTHVDIGIAIGTRPWWGDCSNVGTGACVANNSTGTLSVTARVAMALDGMLNACLSNNTVTWIPLTTTNCPTPTQTLLAEITRPPNQTWYWSSFATTGTCAGSCTTPAYYDSSAIGCLNHLPLPTLTGSPTSGAAPLAGAFDGEPSPPATQSWGFGDGLYSTQTDPSHSFQGSGSFNVSLATTTTTAGPAAITRPGYVSVCGGSHMVPVANFTGTPTGGAAPPVPVSFTDQSVDATSWFWTFGDGATSTLQSPSHTYTSNGWFDVSLTVTNGCGRNTLIKPGYIVVGIVADFEAAPRIGNVLPPPGLAVQFSNDTRPAAGATFSWNFGDGFQSAQKNPQHTYTTAGLFTVSLTATAGGASDTRTKQSYIDVVNTAADPEIMVGVGPDPTNSAGHGSTSTGAGFRYDSGATVVPTRPVLTPYGTAKYGVNVAGGDITGDAQGDILTGPGPGPVSAPHVRAFRTDGTAIQKVSFYAYGTFRYGVNVTAGNMNSDTSREIVTGAGPGEIFGPHVRGWDFDNSSLRAIPGISFYAFGSLKWGVNVATADTVDDGIDEIVAGPGPGPSLTPNVKTYSYSPITPRANFFAFPTSFKYGVKVAAGDWNGLPLGGDANEGVVAAKGPGGLGYDTTLRAFKFNNMSSVTQVADSIAFSGPVFYGANVAVGEVTSDANCQTLYSTNPCETVLAGTGADPAQTPHVRGFEVYNNQFNFLSPLDFFPYGYLDQPPTYGVNVAAVPHNEQWFGSSPPPVVPTDALILVIRTEIAAIPDSTYVCDYCDPGVPQPNWSQWGADSQKTLVLGQMDALHEEVPDWTPSQITGQIDTVSSALADPVLGVLNADALTDLLAELQVLRGRYSPMTFPSTGVTAQIAGVSQPSGLAYSSASGKLFVRPPTAGKVNVLDVPTLGLDPDRNVPTSTGEVKLMGVPPGRSELYVGTRRAVSCFPSTCYTFALERILPPGSVQPDSGYLDLYANTTSASSATALQVSAPGISSGIRADAGWMALADPSGAGVAKAVHGISNFSTATVLTLTVPPRPTVPPVYVAFAPASEGGERLYAAYANGIDAIKTMTTGEPVLADVLTFPGGFSNPKDMTSGTTPLGKKRLFVLNANTLAVYEPANVTPYIGSVTLAGNAIAARLSVDGRFVLVTRHPVSTGGGQPITIVTTVDADALTIVRENPTAVCPLGPSCTVPVPLPMVITVDASHGFVSDPVFNLLDYLYMDPPFGELVPEFLHDAIAGVKDEAWTDLGERDVLLADTDAVSNLFGMAADAADEEARRTILCMAADDLNRIQAKVDGCFSGDPADDVITDCYEATGVHRVTQSLLDGIAPYLVTPPQEP